MVWGRRKNPKLQQALQRSIDSVRMFHPKLPMTIHDLREEGRLLDKARMYDTSPFDETLYLDCDTIVLGDLSFGFEKAEKHGLACSICEAPWAARYHKSIQGDIVEYNTGVMFFRKGDAVKPLFDEWKRLAPITDSSIKFVMTGVIMTMRENDQGSFALAVHNTGFNPCVLPLNWNYRPMLQPVFFGPIKVWHDYEPPGKPLVENLQAQARGELLLQFTKFQYPADTKDLFPGS